MPRTIVIGDVHGCLQELEDLVRLVEYRPGKDRLVLVGDLVDRGPFPRECVVWAMKNHVDVVNGNHEQKVVDFRRKEAAAKAGGPANTMKRPDEPRLSEWMSFTEEELAWMSKLPLWLDLGANWVVVHAGFEPKPLSEQKADRVTRVRWVDEKTGEFVGMKRVPIAETAVVRPAKPHTSGTRPMTPEALALREKRQQERIAKGLPAVAEQPRRKVQQYTTTFEQPDHTQAWQAVWPGPQNIIYGHDAQRSGKPRVDSRINNSCSSDVREVVTLGIDTGCCFGNSLTAAILLDDGHFETIQTPAHKKYFDWPKTDE